MELKSENLGKRIVEMARLAAAMHLERAMRLEPAGLLTNDRPSGRIRIDGEVGGAGPRAQGQGVRHSTDGVQRFTDGAHRFKDEANRLTEEAEDRPRGGAADPQASPPSGGGG